MRPTFNITLNDYLSSFLTPSDDTLTIYEKIDKYKNKIFDFPYDFYTDDESIKSEFENLFITNYLMREIEYPTIDMFKLRLKSKLDLMAYTFKEIYKTIELDYNITDGYKMERTLTRDNTLKEVNNGEQTVADTLTLNTSVTSNGTEKMTGTSTNQKVEQDTPSSRLGDTDYASFITTDTTTPNTTTTNDNTVTNSGNNKKDSTTSANSTSDKTGNENLTETKSGSYIPTSDLILKYRKAIYNINLEMIKELADLFMGVY